MFVHICNLCKFAPLNYSIMKASSLFKEYVWLVNTIRRAGRITLREINERWLRTEMSEGIPYSRTTFRRHRAEVEEMFDIIIDCDGENRYYIEDTDLFRKDSVSNGCWAHWQSATS